jgi:hypothetical protein
MECGGMTPLWLRVGNAGVDGHGLAVSELSGGRFDAAAVHGRELEEPSAPAAKAVSCHRTPQVAYSAFTSRASKRTLVSTTRRPTLPFG